MKHWVLIDWLIDRWFCHVDDDNYLNTDQLLQLLQKYNHTENWYLGKPSLSHPLEIQSRSREGVGTWNLERGGGGWGFFCFILSAFQILYDGLFRFLTLCKAFLPNDNVFTFPWKYHSSLNFYQNHPKYEGIVLIFLTFSLNKILQKIAISKGYHNC